MASTGDLAAMVPRYTRPEMAAIWPPENRYRIWCEIEALAAEGEIIDACVVGEPSSSQQLGDMIKVGRRKVRALIRVT